MAKVSVITPEKAVPAGLPAGFSGQTNTSAYLVGSKDPLHLLAHTIEPGAVLKIGPGPVACLAYVWHGEVEADGHALREGSSLVVEEGGSLALKAGKEPAQVLTFYAATAPDPAGSGGHVHLLPVERVARVDGMIKGVNGGMHFDSDCPTCTIWLHENEFTPEFLTPENMNRGAHSHTEDEIIFITDGQARLGNRLVGPGTALAIHADTMYTFNPGPEGLSFINFRAAKPGDIRRDNGSSHSEAGGWQRQLGGKRPDYLELA
jgi:hypothetical protein